MTLRHNPISTDHDQQSRMNLTLCVGMIPMLDILITLADSLTRQNLKSSKLLQAIDQL
jgi:hypothetical protein